LGKEGSVTTAAGAAEFVSWGGVMWMLPCANMCHAGVSMRDAEIIETELMEISAIADDSTKFERIVAWCACHPEEIPFALHQLMSRRDKYSPETSDT